MKRLISMLLLLSLLFSACSSDGGVDEVTTAAPVFETTVAETTEAGPALELPDEKYDYTVRFFMRDCWDVFPYLTTDIFSEGQNGEVLNDAVYNRLAWVTENYGIEFELFLSSDWNYETDALRVILADQDAYDIIACHTKSAFSYVTNDCCLDWNTDLPYVDLDKPWWDQHARENLAINGFLGTMVGDLSWISLASSKCMFFNKNRFDDIGLEYPYQDVIDGVWTVDKFEQLAKRGSDDLNGDGQYTPEEDQFGYVTGDWDGPIQAITIAGGKYVDRDGDGKLVVSLMNERNAAVYDRLFEFLSTDVCYLQQYDKGFDRHEIFKEGRALFADVTMQYTEKMRDMIDEYGIIPCPKYDETVDAYYTNPDGYTNFFCVPITAYNNVEPISVALEALSWYGNEYVLPAYYEIVLKGKYTRDDQSVQMLDIIKAGRVFDIGYYATDLGSVGYNLAHTKSPNLTTYYAKNVKKFESAIKELNELEF